MKILIDLQPLQTSSKNRGIGRYSFGLAKAISKNSKNHQIFFLLNNCFSENIDQLIYKLSQYIEKKNILIFNSLNKSSKFNESNKWRNKCVTIMYQKFIADISPDIFHVSSFFNEKSDDSVVSIDNSYADYITSVTLYDLIPYFYRKKYFSDKESFEFYLNKINNLTKADVLLSISKYSRKEALQLPMFSNEKIVNISGDTEYFFQKIKVTNEDRDILFQTLNIHTKFIMYTGGIDFRKNIEKLINAYSKLERLVINAHQLLIVCEVSQSDRYRLCNYCKSLGLKENDVIFTGYISDGNLIALYNTCHLSVFPSLCEGFGLPVLEAMRCGAPVIGSNTSSIPEIINYPAALFNPENVTEISGLLGKALLDNKFREKLLLNSQAQQKKFSWDTSAKKAIETFEDIYNKRNHSILTSSCLEKTKKKLAYISPLPLEKSGIADYSAEILPEFKNYYDIILVTEISKKIPELNEFETITIEEFKNDYSSFDRVLYHFGNSEFHEHMFELIENYPGTIILHDFFLSGIYQFMETKNPSAQFFKKALFYSHGYKALSFLESEGNEKTLWRYPCNKKIIDNAIGVIVHSDHSRNLAEQWYGKKILYDWKFVSLSRKIPNNISKSVARKKLKINDSDFMVCTFGNISNTKMNKQLLNAWLLSKLCKYENSRLIFVGSGGSAPYELELKKIISNSTKKKNITITGFVSLSDYKNYLSVADIAVQLRTHSRGETSISVLDCLSHRIPTIVNSHGSFAEIPETVVCRLKDKFSNIELIEALEKLFNSEDYRNTLSKTGENYVYMQCNPKDSVKKYVESIEKLYDVHPYCNHKKLINDISKISGSHPIEIDLIESSISISENSFKKTSKQLFVDISELIKKGPEIGIPRVVRGILNELLFYNLEYRVEPVYRKEGHYFYAHNFTMKFLKLDYKLSKDYVIEIRKDDIFLALGLDIEAEKFLIHQHRRGLKIYSVVYDFLQEKIFFQDDLDEFQHWFNKFSKITNGFICISKTVANNLINLLNMHNPNRLIPLNISCFKLGSNFIKKQVPINKKRISGTISFLMVGTIEPEKNYLFLIDAMEYLWGKNIDVNITIIGKSGCLNENFEEKITGHLQYNKNLFWKQDVLDSELERYYINSDALIMMSECEDFGLPIIESSLYKLPVIARDTLSFNEIGGNDLFYFCDTTPKGLSNSITEWIDLYKKNKHPKNCNLKIVSWKESCTELLNTIFENNCYKTWTSANRIYQEMQFKSVFSKVGEKKDNMIITTGIEGFLIYGPYKKLRSGNYNIKIFGQILFLGNGKSFLEIVCNKGKELIIKVPLVETFNSDIIIDKTFSIYKNSDDIEIRIWVNSFVIAKIFKYIVNTEKEF